MKIVCYIETCLKPRIVASRAFQNDAMNNFLPLVFDFRAVVNVWSTRWTAVEVEVSLAPT